MSSKQAWREHFRSKLNQLQSTDMEHASGKIASHAQKFMQDKTGIWAGFMPLQQEPQINWKKLVPEITWLFPKSNDATLEFYETEQFQVGKFQVTEPVGGKIHPLNQIQGIFIPGLGFDCQGVRLGKGKGYFDKSLSNYKGYKVGVCFGVQITDQQLPTEGHDIKMDFIISEQGIIKAKT